MYKTLTLLISISTLTLAGCTQSQISNFTPPSSPGLAPPPAAFASDLDPTPVSYTDTTNWSKFSFSTFSIFLPKDFQVSTINSDQTTITFANFAYNQNLPYNSDTDHNHFLLTLTLSKPAPAQTEPLIIAGLPATRSSQADHAVLTLANTAQNLAYTLDFSYDFTNNPDLIDLILTTPTFHTRSKI